MVMKKASVFMADGMEETECLTIVDLLRRGGVAVTTFSVMPDQTVTGSHGVRIEADALFDAAAAADADLLFLPGGGGGVKNLYAHQGLCRLLTAFPAESKGAESKYLGAVCAGPSVLGRLGLLKGKRVTCYPGFEDQLLGAIYTGDGITVDGPVVTGIGVGFCVDLGLTLVALLCGQEKSDAVKRQIQHPDCVKKR
jgi:4-methyl-5(b-hydroxyethyl)-thiazole monophosphate biosynthesis